MENNRFRVSREEDLEDCLPRSKSRGFVSREAIAVAYSVGEVLVVDGGCETLLSRRLEEPSSISVSLDLGLIAVGSYRGLLSLYSISGLARWVEDLYWHGGVLSLSLSSRGRLAVGTLSGGLFVFDTSGKLLWRKRRGFVPLRGSSPVYFVEWSKSGDELIVAAGSELHLYDRSGEEIWSIRLEAPAITGSWSPESRLIATGLKNRGLIVVSSEGDVVYSRDLQRKPFSLAWHGDGVVFVATGYRFFGDVVGSIEAYSRRGNHLWSSGDLGTSPITGIGPSPCGRDDEYLALPSLLDEIYVVKAE